MKSVKAFDVDGNELKHGDTVEVIADKEGFPHTWLKIGNKLKVSYWEDRSWLGKDKYVVVFLETKGGRLCHQGMQDVKLRKVENK